MSGVAPSRVLGCADASNDRAGKLERRGRGGSDCAKAVFVYCATMWALGDTQCSGGVRRFFFLIGEAFPTKNNEPALLLSSYL